MRQFALVVVVSTLLSLFVSFTITPMLASRFGKLEHLTKGTLMGRFGLWFESLYDKFTQHYLNLLKWSLNNCGKVALATIAMFVASVALVPAGFIGSEFIAVADRGEFAVTLELPPGAKLEQTNYITQEVERALAGMSEVKKTFVNVGVSSEGLIGQSSNNNSEINVTLVPREERRKSSDEIAQEIKTKVQGIPGVKVRVNPIGIFGVANQTPIQLVVGGPSREDVVQAANIVAEVIRKIPGTADVWLSSEEGNPETRVEIDRKKMAAFGLTVSDVGATLKVALSGDDDSKYRDGANEYSIRIQLDEFDRSQTAGIGSLTFINNKGQQVELKQFATIYQTTGPTKLQRTDRNSAIVLFSQVVGRPSGSVAQDINLALKQAQLPSGITLSYQGDVKNQAESFGSLGLALMAGILFVYMIMVALYNSYVYPFVVLFSIPVAIVGALLALALTMKSLSIFSMLGIIMLVGLVGKNAILLVDRANQMRAEGLSTMDALIEAGQTRLRPILMTTVAMIIGMMPIALSGSAGAEWETGLAWAIIGGLTSSMLLTLVVVPVVYVKVDRLRESVPALFRKPFAALRRRSKKASAGEVLPEPVAAVEFSEIK
jgi:HAE1 family hydrophobic/amphiphilic exporter-1